MYIKEKKIKLSNVPTSPKSSLRPVGSRKNLGIQENKSIINSINLAETTDIQNWKSATKVEKPVSSKVVQSLIKSSSNSHLKPATVSAFTVGEQR